MRVLERDIQINKQTDLVRIYPVGDVHVGALNFAEKQFKTYVNKISADKDGYWIGGGDMLDAVILQDQKRFNPNNIPDWMLNSSPEEARLKLSDILKAQMDYLYHLLDPIKDKCLGLIEGNHEYSIAHYHNRDLMSEVAERFNTDNLTDCAFIRLNLKHKYSKKRSAIRIFITHGHGGGRTAGAEPNHLARLSQDKDCEVVLRGHSHTFTIVPPIPRLTIPLEGELGKEADVNVIRAANWGCWLLSYATGPSTYDSRATYPVRPMCASVVEIQPFTEDGVPEIVIKELPV